MRVRKIRFPTCRSWWTVGEIVLTNDGGTVVLNQLGATVGITSMTHTPAPVILSPAQLSSQYGKVMSVNRLLQPSSTGGEGQEEKESSKEKVKGFPRALSPRPGSDFGENTKGDLGKVKATWKGPNG